MTDLLLTEAKKQHDTRQLAEESAGDVTSAFLKSWEILNFEPLEAFWVGT